MLWAILLVLGAGIVLLPKWLKKKSTHGHGTGGSGGHGGHHEEKKGALYVLKKCLFPIYDSHYHGKIDIILGAFVIWGFVAVAIWIGAWIWSSESGSKQRWMERQARIEQLKKTDPTAFYWTLTSWDENGRPMAYSTLVVFTTWTTQEMEYRMPLLGNSSKYTVYHIIPNKEFGTWYEEASGDRGQFSGWFKLNSFPNFGGNIDQIDGIWGNGSNGQGKVGKFRLVRGGPRSL